MSSTDDTHGSQLLGKILVPSRQRTELHPGLSQVITIRRYMSQDVHKIKLPKTKLPRLGVEITFVGYQLSCPDYLLLS